MCNSLYLFIFFPPPDEAPAPVLPSGLPMALAFGQQQLTQAATLEHLKEKLERGAAAGSAANGPEKKMKQLAEEQQRLMQQALQQNLLALASHFNPMGLKVNSGQGEFPPQCVMVLVVALFLLSFFFSPTEGKQDLSVSISTNGAASINVSMEVNGTTYSGEQNGLLLLFFFFAMHVLYHGTGHDSFVINLSRVKWQKSIEMIWTNQS